MEFIFYFLSSVLLFSALRVITSQNPVYSALFLVLSFFSAAGIWLLLQAEFLAIALVLVYVGAVMVLFLFVIISIITVGIIGQSPITNQIQYQRLNQIKSNEIAQTGLELTSRLIMEIDLKTASLSTWSTDLSNASKCAPDGFALTMASPAYIMGTHTLQLFTGLVEGDSYRLTSCVWSGSGMMSTVATRSVKINYPDSGSPLIIEYLAF